MTNEQQRAAFEAEMQVRHSGYSLEYENGWYRYSPTQRMWLIWQAAIAYLAEEYRIELDKVSQRNYELSKENAGLKAAIAQDRQSRGEPVAWLTQCISGPFTGRCEIAKKDTPTLNTAYWSQPFPVFREAAQQPVEPCATRNDNGAVGNILNAEPCPDCTPQGAFLDSVVYGQGPVFNGKRLNPMEIYASEPVKGPSDEEIIAMGLKHTQVIDGLEYPEGAAVEELDTLGFARDLLASYGNAAQPAASAVPLYQVRDRRGSGSWTDVSKEHYDHRGNFPDIMERRVIYTTPIAAQPSVPPYPADAWVDAFFGKPDETGFYHFRGDFGNIAYAYGRALPHLKAAPTPSADGQAQQDDRSDWCRIAGCSHKNAGSPVWETQQGADKDAAYEAGWRTAAKWTEREDLVSDIGSTAYELDKRQALEDAARTNGGQS